MWNYFKKIFGSLVIERGEEEDVRFREYKLKNAGWERSNCKENNYFLVVGG